jgi:archaellum component FlaC
MADFESLEKKIDTLTQATKEGFVGVGARFTDLEKQITDLTQATAEGFVKVESRLENLEKHAGMVDQKLERIERNIDGQMQNHMALETRVTKLEQPVV